MGKPHMVDCVNFATVSLDKLHNQSASPAGMLTVRCDIEACRPPSPTKNINTYRVHTVNTDVFWHHHCTNTTRLMKFPRVFCT